jgi:hypothetical protein
MRFVSGVESVMKIVADTTSLMVSTSDGDANWTCDKTIPTLTRLHATNHDSSSPHSTPELTTSEGSTSPDSTCLHDFRMSNTTSMPLCWKIRKDQRPDSAADSENDSLTRGQLVYLPG